MGPELGWGGGKIRSMEREPTRYKKKGEIAYRRERGGFRQVVVISTTKEGKENSIGEKSSGCRNAGAWVGCVR